MIALRNRLRWFLALGAVATVVALPLAPSAAAKPTDFVPQSAKSCKASKRCSHTSASHLRAGEFCAKCAQSFYRRHGYVCKRASDGRLRLFTR